MWDGTDRRKHKRYGVKNSTIRYARTGLLSFLSNYSERYLLLNISEGGIYFITREELAIGEKLALILEFPSTKEEISIKLKGNVVWTKKSEEHEAFRTGVKITHINEKNREIMRRVLDNAVLDSVKIPTGVYLKELKKL